MLILPYIFDKESFYSFCFFLCFKLEYNPLYFSLEMRLFLMQEFSFFNQIQHQISLFRPQLKETVHRVYMGGPLNRHVLRNTVEFKRFSFCRLKWPLRSFSPITPLLVLMDHYEPIQDTKSIETAK